MQSTWSFEILVLKELKGKSRTGNHISMLVLLWSQVVEKQLINILKIISSDSKNTAACKLIFALPSACPALMHREIETNIYSLLSLALNYELF